MSKVFKGVAAAFLLQHLYQCWVCPHGLLSRTLPNICDRMFLENRCRLKAGNNF